MFKWFKRPYEIVPQAPRVVVRSVGWTCQRGVWFFDLMVSLRGVGPSRHYGWEAR